MATATASETPDSHFPVLLLLLALGFFLIRGKRADPYQLNYGCILASSFSARYRRYRPWWDYNNITSWLGLIFTSLTIYVLGCYSFRLNPVRGCCFDHTTGNVTSGGFASFQTAHQWSWGCDRSYSITIKNLSLVISKGLGSPINILRFGEDNTLQILKCLSRAVARQSCFPTIKNAACSRAAVRPFIITLLYSNH